jgi:hypothetical protein
MMRARLVHGQHHSRSTVSGLPTMGREEGRGGAPSYSQVRHAGSVADLNKTSDCGCLASETTRMFPAYL